MEAYRLSPKNISTFDFCMKYWDRTQPTLAFNKPKWLLTYTSPNDGYILTDCNFLNEISGSCNMGTNSFLFTITLNYHPKKKIQFLTFDIYGNRGTWNKTTDKPQAIKILIQFLFKAEDKIKIQLAGKKVGFNKNYKGWYFTKTEERKILSYDFMNHFVNLKGLGVFTSQFLEYLRRKQRVISIGFKP